MANAIVSTVRPKASDTPTKPMPSSGKAAANTADPHPPNTSQAVPMNSATSLRVMPRPSLCVPQAKARRVTVGSRLDEGNINSIPGDALSAAPQRDDIGTGSNTFIGEGHRRRRPEAKTVTGAQVMALAAFGQGELSFADP